MSWRVLAWVCLFSGVAGLPAAADATANLLDGLADAAATRRMATCDSLKPEHATDRGGKRLVLRTERLCMGDGDPRVRVAAARALGRMQQTRSRPTLWNSAERDADPEVADTAALALGRLADAKQVDKLLALVRGGPVKHRLIALRALTLTADPRVRETLRFALSADAHFVPRVAAALGLGSRANADIIEMLVGRAHSDTHAAVRAACAEALEQATGKRLGADPDAWKRAHHAGELRPGGARPAPAPTRERYADTSGDKDHWTVTYWGLSLVPDGTLFCFDVSGSMNYFERLGMARRELNRAVGQMRTDDRFGVLFFSDRFTLWLGRFVPANPFTKLALHEHMQEQEAKRYTDLLGMFERAFGVGGTGRFAMPVPERLRQMCVLTDGTPSRNFVTDLPFIRRKVREWNPGGRVRVHTIGLGSSDEAFLQALADENRGKFVPKRH